MASGVPVVASDIAIFKEILSDAAVLVNPRDVESIADGIHRIVKDDDFRKTLIQKGSERTRKYSWNQTARITLQAYREAAGTGSAQDEETE
jgi:glycosyltransferase involved in cell wall biosynthesis